MPAPELLDDAQACLRSLHGGTRSLAVYVGTTVLKALHSTLSSLQGALDVYLADPLGGMSQDDDPVVTHLDKPATDGQVDLLILVSWLQAKLSRAQSRQKRRVAG